MPLLLPVLEHKGYAPLEHLDTFFCFGEPIAIDLAVFYLIKSSGVSS